MSEDPVAAALAELNGDTPPEAEESKEGRKKWMKAYGQRNVMSGERAGQRVYGGGGIVRFRDGEKKIKMVPGEIREVPDGVVERMNAGDKKVFVEPGSQKEGDVVKEPKPRM